MLFGKFDAVRKGAVVACFLLLTGCDKVTQANYEKIQTDMSSAEVREILGEPSETSSINFGPVSGTSSVWKGKESSITVQFLNGKVKLKNMEK